MENQKIKIVSNTFFSDPDKKTTTWGQHTYTASGLPSGLTINDQGRIVGRLPEGKYTFTVTATDGGDLKATQTITIIVGKKPGDEKPRSRGDSEGEAGSRAALNARVRAAAAAALSSVGVGSDAITLLQTG